MVHDSTICKYDDLLKPMLFLIYQEPKIRKPVLEALGLDANQFNSIDQYTQWVGLCENNDNMLYNALEVLIVYLHLKRNDRLPR
jgi:hypothetical protein